ncbi:hypothetical protein BDN71DRAFT_1458452, partial [Pleurotus eryngii]
MLAPFDACGPGCSSESVPSYPLSDEPPIGSSSSTSSTSTSALSTSSFSTSSSWSTVVVNI